MEGLSTGAKRSLKNLVSRLKIPKMLQNHIHGELDLKLGSNNKGLLQWKLTKVGWNQLLPFSYCTPNAAKRLRLQIYILPTTKQRPVMTQFGLVFVKRWAVLQVETERCITQAPGLNLVELRIALADIPDDMDDPNGSVVLGPIALKKLRCED